jgi:glycerol-3-phosphate cytidylyltransferase
MIRGFACGIFDLYHPGHVIMLEECKKHCDYLVIALNSGINLSLGKNNPIFTLEERLIILNSVKFIDEIITYESESELEFILISGNFQVRFLGEDYLTKEITAKDAVEKLVFLNRDHGYSTSKLRELIVERSKK